MTDYSVIEYQYRDGGGTKVYRELLIAGDLSDSDLKLLHGFMYDGMFFTPEEVGIAPLHPIIWEEFGGPIEEDHDWHTIEDIRKAEPEDMNMPVWGTKEELFQQFRANRERFRNTMMDSFFPS